jgi:hypothetical protein
MLKHRCTFPTVLALIALIGLTTAPMSGCEDLPGSRTEQSTVIGGATGAVLGAVIAKENRLIGALIGGLLGAGGGYLIGAKTDWFKDDDKDDARNEARDAVNKAQTDPATVEEARDARTADINDDGFVTLDEVIALERADFSDNQIITRLERTNQVFDLNDQQREILRDNGVSQKVIDRMLEINRNERERLLTRADRDDVISDDRN